jgi:hypothetical protein
MSRSFPRLVYLVGLFGLSRLFGSSGSFVQPKNQTNQINQNERLAFCLIMGQGSSGAKSHREPSLWGGKPHYSPIIDGSSD